MKTSRVHTPRYALVVSLTRRAKALRVRAFGGDGVLSVDALDACIRAFSVGIVLALSFAGYGRGDATGNQAIADPILVALGLVAYNLLVTTLVGVPWRRSPAFPLFVVDWLVASVAILLAGGFFSPFVVLYYALCIGAALRVGLARSLALVGGCAAVYLALSLAHPDPVEAIRLPLLVVEVTSLVMVVVTAVGMKRAVEVEARRVQLEEQSASQLRLLNNLTNTVLSASPDLEQVMRAVASASSQAVQADSGMTLLFVPEAAQHFDREPDTTAMLLVTDANLNPPRLSENETKLLSQVVRTQMPVQVKNTHANPAPEPHAGYTGLERHGAEVRTVACVPLCLNEEVIGALFVGRYEQHPFSEADMGFLTAIGQQMAVAVRLASLYEMEREKAQRSEERERLERDLLSMVSHELRTPLTSIKTSVGALTSNQETNANLSTEARLVQNIDRSTDRLIGLVNELLDMSRLRAGRVSLNLQQLNVGDVIRDSATQIRPLLEARRQSLEIDLPAQGSPRWEQIYVVADRRRLEQVLTNLLSNANKYAPEGAHIVVGATPKDGHVRVFVRDNGPGIPPGEQGKVFEQFYQASPGAKAGVTRQDGMGLGLAIARSIVELHGGQIGVHSRHGLGSTFYFSLRQSPRFDGDMPEINHIAHDLDVEAKVEI